MEKRKRWQRLLIISVLFLTIYNILPTLFFYSKPLKKLIDDREAHLVANRIADRVNALEQESVQWIHSFCRLLGTKPLSVSVDESNPDLIVISFKDSQTANRFKMHLPRGGSLIPFAPKQLSIYGSSDPVAKSVIVQRKIPLRLSPSAGDFEFSKKFDLDRNPTPFYQQIVFDRAIELAMAIGGPSQNGKLVQAIAANPSHKSSLQSALRLAYDIVNHIDLFGETSPCSKRYFSSFSQVETPNPTALIQQFYQGFEQIKDRTKLQRIELQAEAQSLQAQGEFLDTAKQELLEQLSSQEKILDKAVRIVKKQQHLFASSKGTITPASLRSDLEEGFALSSRENSKKQSIFFLEKHPYIASLSIDWNQEQFDISLHADVDGTKAQLLSLGKKHHKDQIDQLIYNAVAYASREASEEIHPQEGGFQIKLSQLEGSDSLLSINLSKVAKAHADRLKRTLVTSWHPKHIDLQAESFPIWDYATYLKLPEHEKKLGLVIYAPVAESDGRVSNGLHSGSIYVIAKGLDKILQKGESAPQSEERKQFLRDFNELKELLKQAGLIGYPGASLGSHFAFAGDFIFEAEEVFATLLKATREPFSVPGSKRMALLELTDIEQRILAENNIDNQIHEDLLKWRDDFRAAQLEIGGATRYDVPKPTQNVLWSNLGLSLRKYFRGDDRKVLRWGLDLSGGKTIQLELRDSNMRPVVNEEQIDQGINELHGRVNKMGVSEVGIRKEGNLVTVDFPGLQGLSAKELIKASTMYFHLVNEKFNDRNPSLAHVSNEFLQDVWNEAVITGRKSAEEINQIAWRHLHGESLDTEIAQPRTESARILYENGLRIASASDHTGNNQFNDTVSKIAIQRGSTFTDWHGKTHPLLIVFRNFALEGSNLSNVEVGYDPNKGNFLTFQIKGKETLKSGEVIRPRENLFSWTSQFSRDKIGGTQVASYSSNEGWRMAVILNESVITAPSLNAPIKEGGTIEGGFTQRELNKLEADLKAGSLSFTPHVVSEKNVSPDLGAKERALGLTATALALLSVITLMILYYRFAGFIASVAVFINLLIMWAILQNLGATLTLASIAAAVLTLGMAVDANVLVFERIREELSLSGRLASALQVGYRKAFSAILDSNITSIIAAIVLLQFDSGPIKGFAVTLIIGIISSMFTSLFMTRYFFSWWIQNPKHISLKMLNLVRGGRFNFLKKAKVAYIASALLIVSGGYLLVEQRHSILGMDFTGGYSLSFDLKLQGGEGQVGYRERVEAALTKAGATSRDFQVRQLTNAHQIRLFLSKGMGQPGKPFYGMPLETENRTVVHPYERNPRICWIVAALADQNISLSPQSLASLELSWSEISGQLSDSMRNGALIALGIALVGILLYITIRFEFKYAVSTTLCILHDVVATIACIGILSFLGAPLQIDLNTITALLTIVGYSLNDTIIVFDRIREDLKVRRKSSFYEVVNHALNVTLSRTMLTSGTTLVALLPLVVLTGSTLFAFALVMAIGVVIGTLSSLFIATPILNYFHGRQIEKEKLMQEIAQQ